jgi:hypothetical protein
VIRSARANGLVSFFSSALDVLGVPLRLVGADRYLGYQSSVVALARVQTEGNPPQTGDGRTELRKVIASHSPIIQHVRTTRSISGHSPMAKVATALVFITW